MSAEEYQARMASMGIERGALSTGFEMPEQPRTVGRKESPLLNKRASARVRAATLGLAMDDLSLLNPENSAFHSRRLRGRRKGRRT